MRRSGAPAAHSLRAPPAAASPRLTSSSPLATTPGDLLTPSHHAQRFAHPVATLVTASNQRFCYQPVRNRHGGLDTCVLVTTWRQQ